jgi:beta-glucosidase
VTADLSRAAKGRTDVYLVLRGEGLRLATFSLR